MAKRAPRARKPKDRFLSKGDEFLLLAQTAVQAAMQTIISTPDLMPRDRLDRVQLLAKLLSDAVTVVPRIPADMSALAAANDFLAYALDPGPHWNDPPERPVPARWMGLREQDDVQAYNDLTWEEIDGRFQLINPEWAGLPYNDSARLRLLVCVRERETATLAKLVAAVPLLNGDKDAVVALLAELTDDGWLTATGGKTAPRWHATEKLIATPLGPTEEALHVEQMEQAEAGWQRPPALPAEEPPPPARDRHAEWAAAKKERQHLLPDRPDARALLERLGALKRAATRELQPAVPHLDRNATVRLLKLLRDAGWVEVVGDRRNAVWKRTRRRLRPLHVEEQEMAQQQIEVTSAPVGLDEFVTVADLAEADQPVEVVEVPRRPPRPRVALKEADVKAVAAFFRAHPGARSKDVRVALPHLTMADTYKIAERLCRGMGFYRRHHQIFYDAALVQ